jgi:hypothetical protein
VRGLCRIGDSGNQGADLIVEAQPLIGQRDCARVPVEQASTQLLFEAGNAATDTRGGDAEQASSRPETARMTMATNVTPPLSKRDERFI